MQLKCCLFGLARALPVTRVVTGYDRVIFQRNNSTFHLFFYQWSPDSCHRSTVVITASHSKKKNNLFNDARYSGESGPFIFLMVQLSQPHRLVPLNLSGHLFRELVRVGSEVPRRSSRKQWPPLLCGPGGHRAGLGLWGFMLPVAGEGKRMEGEV